MQKNGNFNFSLTKEVRRGHQPKRAEVAKLIKSSLQLAYKNVSLAIIITSKARSAELNLAYRNIASPTNVISLEYKDMRDEYGFLMGEIILCDDIIIAEASKQNKPISTHYAHLIIHGILHLQGFDHYDDQTAKVMESLEIEIMDKLGFANPYK